MKIVPAEGQEMAVVLHEDKKYYPTAEEVYGPDVEVRERFLDVCADCHPVSPDHCPRGGHTATYWCVVDLSADAIPTFLSFYLLHPTSLSLFSPCVEPIIAPVKKHKFLHVEKQLPLTTYNTE